jgi:hypothetical protein
LRRWAKNEPAARQRDRGQPRTPSFCNGAARLSKTYGLVLPNQSGAQDWSLEAQRAGFLQFLKFLRGNLAGQTGLPVDPAWASQTAILQGMAQVKLLDLLLRAEELPNALPALAGQDQAFVLPNPCDPNSLSEIYTTEIEEVCAVAYRRDYVSFGFGAWA